MMEIIVKILLPAFGLVILILISLLQRKTERIKIIEAKLYTSKKKAYGELFSLFFEQLINMKLKKNDTSHKTYIKLMEAKKTIFTYGSDRVVKAFSIWLSHSSSNRSANINKTIQLLFNLFIEMRKDLGYTRTNLTLKDFLIYLMQDELEVGKFEELISETNR